MENWLHICIWFLSCRFDFKGEILGEAIEKTFEKRDTPIDLNAAPFEHSFGTDRDKDVQWRGFIRKAKLIGAPERFEEIVAAVRLFLEPLVAAIAEQKAFNSIWITPGPWRWQRRSSRAVLKCRSDSAKKCGDRVGKIVQNRLKCGKSPSMTYDEHQMVIRAAARNRLT